MEDCSKFGFKALLGAICIFTFPIIVYIVIQSAIDGALLFLMGAVIFSLGIIGAVLVSPYMECLNKNAKARNP